MQQKMTKTYKYAKKKQQNVSKKMTNITKTKTQWKCNTNAEACSTQLLGVLRCTQMY